MKLGKGPWGYPGEIGGRKRVMNMIDPQPLLYSSNTCTYVAYSLLQIYMNINK